MSDPGVESQPADPTASSKAGRKRAADLLGDLITGAYVAGLVGLGVRLDLYRVMTGRGAMTSGDVSSAAGLDERWVREWLFAQAAAGIIDQRRGERFELSDDMAELLAEPSSVAFLGAHFRGLPERLEVTPRLEAAFRSGTGFSFDDLGQTGAAETEAVFANWYRHLLVPVGLAALEGGTDRLESGTRVADVGCGSGVALLEMAKAYPRCELHGFDVSPHALARAEANRQTAGVGNVTFHDARRVPLDSYGPYGLVTTFDCLHDMTRPETVVASISANLEAGGVWLVADIACGDSFEDNLARPRLAALLYATSVYSCLPSGLAEPGGAGLGTCGLPPRALQELGRAHGFTHFRRLPIDHPVNAFYELRR